MFLTLHRFRLLCASLALLLLLVSASGRAFAEPPKVVVSLLPIHGLTAQIMAGVGEPQLLMEAGASPHGYQLRPSDARLLESAGLVIWVGPPMEGFLKRPLLALSDPGRQLPLISLDGLRLVAGSEGHGHSHGHDHENAGHDHEDAGHGHEEAGHGHEEAGHGEEEVDGHIWLDPQNAAVMLKGIAERLQALDPANAARYRSNLAASLEQLDALDGELRDALAPLQDRLFVVFHDAYQGFVRHYGLQQAGAVALSPERPPGARHLSALRALIAEKGVTCLFGEPQFRPAVLESLEADLNLQVGQLDPLGVGLTPGAGAYDALMRGLARSFMECLR